MCENQLKPKADASGEFCLFLSLLMLSGTSPSPGKNASIGELSQNKLMARCGSKSNFLFNNINNKQVTPSCSHTGEIIKCKYCHMQL